ncbi:Molybdopterin molybdenumtransferase [Thalassoglobus neptunius]|uniref:Molybdopterin molybdenumtransferase n=1 Tax=Thalassoglobus neptunius TaxID=1938619 RepID=A0A5C5X5N4_9PLAN|nr:gephyrin-like molybdotransferase Glp [Thalassoglobus neptunius]TWT58417.1 Molybdopterin molybdenumtransferase [Thalassoglobus neptunius]
MLSVIEALDLIRDRVLPGETSVKPLSETLGHTVAESILSPIDSPPFDKSMMDGFAIRTEDFAQGAIPLSLVGQITAGESSDSPLQSGETVQIMTGAPIPPNVDAVVPVELSSVENGVVHLNVDPAQLRSGWNIIPRGSNMQQGIEVLSTGSSIRPQEIALLGEIGKANLRVHHRPRVAVLATGNELVDVGEDPGPGQIRNSNALMLAAQVESCGAIPVVLGIARDNRDDLRDKVQAGLECAMLCLSGGVSAGTLDLVPSVLAEAGVEPVFHKLAMKPGKPIWFGSRNDAANGPCYVFGLPGNPVSSMVCFELFVRTALRKFCGDTQTDVPLQNAHLKRDFQQRGDRQVWFPSTLEFEGGKAVVNPVDWKGSSDLRSTLLANCSAVFDAGDNLYQAGELVNVLVWSRPLFAT